MSEQQTPTPSAVAATPRPPVAVLSPAGDYDGRYSVARMVQNQVRQLKAQGHRVLLFAQDGFQTAVPEDQWEADELVVYDRDCALPRGGGEDQTRWQRGCLTAANVIRGGCERFGARVLLAHDILLVEQFAVLNRAVRHLATPQRLGEPPWGIPTYVWFHSVPRRMEDVPDSQVRHLFYTRIAHPSVQYVVPHDQLRHSVMERYVGVRAHEVHTVQNFQAVRDSLCLTPVGERAFVDHRVWERTQVLTCMGRCSTGKQYEKAINLLAGLKTLGENPLLFLLMTYSEGDHDDHYRDLVSRAERLGVRQNLVLAEDLAGVDGARTGLAWTEAQQFWRMSDFVLSTSLVEAFGLTISEGVLNGCTPILNADDPVQLSHLGLWMEGARYQQGLGFSFGSLERPLGAYVPSEAEWFLSAARTVRDAYLSNPSLSARRTHRQHANEHWVYENQLYPLVNPPL